MPYFIIQGPKPLIGGNPYVGPGDLVPNARAWWGLRGYNAAYCTGGMPCFDCVDAATGLNSSTINILSSGDFDAATFSAKPNSQAISKLYDQTGNGNHLLQATLSAMPNVAFFNFIPPTTVRSALFAGLNDRMVTAGALTQVQPFSVSCVGEQFNGGSTGGIIEDLDTNGFMYAVGPAVDQIQMFNGTNTLVASTDAVPHAWQFIANGAGSLVVVDASVSVVNPGTGGSAGRIAVFQRGAGPTGDAFAKFAEFGIWNGAFSSIDYVAMRANQQTYWGTP